MQEPDSSTNSTPEPLGTSDNIECLVTNSDFYITNSDATQPPWLSPGDTLLVDMQNTDGGLPQLSILNRERKQNLAFTTINEFCKIEVLSAMSLFVSFNVELKESPGIQWRFELLTQRLPARTSCKANNQDIEVQFYFFILDGRFDNCDTSCGQTQHQSSDGSGGGFVR